MFLPKQKRFCDIYIRLTREGVKGVGEKAAREAGYSEHSAKEMVCYLMKQPKIKAYIKKHSVSEEQAKEKAFVYTMSDSFKVLNEIQTLAREKKQRMVLRRGTVVQEFDDADLSNMNRAEELKGKMAGLYKHDEEQAKPTTIMNIIRHPSRLKGD